MRIRLIQPAQLDGNGGPTKFEKLFFPNLGLPTVAALTPAGVEVGITTEYVEEIDFDEKPDLVGVTAQTCQAPRAYQIADEFRKRGVPTILGGIHAAARVEETLEHFDAVLVGEAEDVWERIVADARRRDLRRVYRHPRQPDLSRLAVPRFDLLDYGKYVVPPLARTPLIPIQATRGCPHDCDFCSVSRFWGHRIRKKPVSHVIREIEAVRPSRVFFTDDNIGADPQYAAELFRALAPLRLRWACQMSTTIAGHPGLIEAAGAAGCHETLIGIESTSESNLTSVNKGFNVRCDYRALLARLKRAGILAQVSLIFGLEGDTAASLERMIDAVLEWDANYVYIALLTPFPGTKLYERLAAAGRIANPDWSAYDVTHPVMVPPGMSRGELETTMWRMYEKCYSAGRILGRAWRFGRQYLCFFPRDNVFEETFFQFHIRNSVRRRTHPFSMGFELKR